MRVAALAAVSTLGVPLALGGCGSATGPPSSGIPRHGVTVMLTLAADHVAAGSALRGELIVTNRTGRAIVVRSCPADGLFEVGLRSASVPFVATNGAVACTTRLPRGRSSRPVEVEALYAGCGGTGQVRCRRGPHPVPPLAAGTYETTVDLEGVPHAVAPAPRVVTVRSAARP